MSTAPELSVIEGAPRPRWRVEYVSPHQEGRRRRSGYFQAVYQGAMPGGLEPECGHEHRYRYQAHRCGRQLFGASAEEDRSDD